MSTDYTACVVFGLRVPLKTLEKALKDRQPKKDLSPIVTKGCDHTYDDKCKFCPQCGKPAKIIETPEEEDPDVWEFLYGVNDMGILYATDGCNVENVFFTTVDKWMKSLDLKNDDAVAAINYPTEEELAKIKAKLEEKLAPYGVYNEKNVKMWFFGNVG